MMQLLYQENLSRWRKENKSPPTVNLHTVDEAALLTVKSH